MLKRVLPNRSSGEWELIEEGITAHKQSRRQGEANANVSRLLDHSSLCLAEHYSMEIHKPAGDADASFANQAPRYGMPSSDSEQLAQYSKHSGRDAGNDTPHSRSIHYPASPGRSGELQELQHPSTPEQVHPTRPAAAERSSAGLANWHQESGGIHALPRSEHQHEVVIQTEVRLYEAEALDSGQHRILPQNAAQEPVEPALSQMVTRPEVRVRQAGGSPPAGGSHASSGPASPVRSGLQEMQSPTPSEQVNSIGLSSAKPPSAGLSDYSQVSPDVRPPHLTSGCQLQSAVQDQLLHNDAEALGKLNGWHQVLPQNAAQAEPIEPASSQSRENAMGAQGSGNEILKPDEWQRISEQQLEDLLHGSANDAAVVGQDGKGNTLMHLAVLWGRMDQLQRVLALPGAQTAMRQQNTAGYTPLHCAAMLGSEQKLGELLQQPEAAQEICRPDGRSRSTALHLAVLFGSRQATELLLRHEAARPAIMQPNAQGNTPLHYAVTAGDAGNAFHLLRQLEAQAIFGSQDAQGSTPLHVAAAAKHSGHMEQLLSHPEGLQAIALRNQWGLSVVHTAAAYAPVQNLERLLKEPEARALLCKQDNDGNTPLHLAIYNRLPAYTKPALQEIRDLCAASPAAMDLPTPAAASRSERLKLLVMVMSHELSEDMPAVLTQLLRWRHARAAMHQRNIPGQNPLHAAVHGRSTRIIECLLPSSEGRTASTQVDKAGRLPLDNPKFSRLSARAQQLLLSSWMSGNHKSKPVLHEITLSDYPEALAGCISTAGPAREVPALAEINRQHVQHSTNGFHWSQACAKREHAVVLLEWQPEDSILWKIRAQRLRPSRSSLVILSHAPMIGLFVERSKSTLLSRQPSGLTAAQLALGLLEQHLHVESSLRLQAQGAVAEGQRVEISLEHLILTVQGSANGKDGFGHFPFLAEVRAFPSHAQAAAAPAVSSCNEAVETTSTHGASVTGGAILSMAGNVNASVTLSSSTAVKATEVPWKQEPIRGGHRWRKEGLFGNEEDELESATSPVQMARTASKPGSSPKAGAAPRPKPVKERKDRVCDYDPDAGFKPCV
ncbi:hypothetical protein WJX74_004585 [Apatococcus lobatus]|uniref:Uncharacterized protein n=1 Tax=Apatococcus lobatus TaxID=904363 RepID=A0AAW1RYS3_9CHLO